MNDSQKFYVHNIVEWNALKGILSYMQTIIKWNICIIEATRPIRKIPQYGVRAMRKSIQYIHVALPIYYYIYWLRAV